MKSDLIDEATEIRSKDPARALELASRFISENPLNPRGYYSRYQTWLRFGETERALRDCTTALELEENSLGYQCRGNLYRLLGNLPRALDDFDTAKRIDFRRWLTSFGPHERADTLARLGRLEEALADCMLIAEDHWMPAHDGLPGGDKSQFIAEIRRRALDALTGGKTTPPITYVLKQFPLPPGIERRPA